MVFNWWFDALLFLLGGSLIQGKWPRKHPGLAGRIPGLSLKQLLRSVPRQIPAGKNIWDGVTESLLPVLGTAFQGCSRPWEESGFNYWGFNYWRVLGAKEQLWTGLQKWEFPSRVQLTQTGSDVEGEALKLRLENGDSGSANITFHSPWCVKNRFSSSQNSPNQEHNWGWISLHGVPFPLNILSPTLYFTPIFVISFHLNHTKTWILGVSFQANHTKTLIFVFSFHLNPMKTSCEGLNF